MVAHNEQFIRKSGLFKVKTAQEQRSGRIRGINLHKVYSATQNFLEGVYIINSLRYFNPSNLPLDIEIKAHPYQLEKKSLNMPGPSYVSPL